MNEETKTELLALAENLTEDAVGSVFNLIEAFVKNSPNKIDDTIEPFLPMAKNFVLGFVKNIDGE
jgi:hypothetical protein